MFENFLHHDDDDTVEIFVFLLCGQMQLKYSFKTFRW